MTGQRRPRLCLNMIVRNEAAIIGRALRSTLGTVDCCVICDTGSTDATVAIVSEFCARNGLPCEVHEFPFIDFSQARNEALDRARRSALDFDYLLLFDADMELVVEEASALVDLRSEGALLRQVSASLAYDNMRLLRRTAEARYVGATHEALMVTGEVIRLDGLHFIDHTDGANRPEKFTRDARLLRAALARDPSDLRAMFYLAQTLRDAGHHAEALEWYSRREEAGGWDEERWYARYQMAACRQALGDVPGFVADCLEAYAGRPTRAEPLVCLAMHYARVGRHDAALLLLEQAAATPHPRDDRLFVEHDAYGDAVREAIAISGFYSALPARVEAGRRACEALAIDAQAAPNRRETARANLHFYARPIVAICPSTRLHPIELAMPEPFVATNPSFVHDGAGYLGIVRGVNYRIEGGGYRIFDADQRVRTRNFLIRLDAGFAVTDVHPMRDLAALPRDAAGRIVGFEDCRLFRWRNGWWCSATARDLDADATAQMVLLRLDGNGDFADAHALRGYGDDLHQKNWMPLIDERLRFVYSLGPTIVVDASAANGSFVVDSGVDPGIAIEHWRGGTPLLPWADGHLTLVHEAKNTPQGRHYAHRFVTLDVQCRPVAASDAFVFRSSGVEFAAGLTTSIDGRSLVIAFGHDDCGAALAIVAVDEVRAILRPLTTD